MPGPAGRCQPWAEGHQRLSVAGMEGGPGPPPGTSGWTPAVDLDLLQDLEKLERTLGELHQVEARRLAAELESDARTVTCSGVPGRRRPSWPDPATPGRRAGRPPHGGGRGPALTVPLCGRRMWRALLDWKLEGGTTAWMV